MNFKVKISLLMLIIIATSVTKILAQNKSSYEVGINIGTLIYQGDLTQSALGSTKDLKPAISIYVGKELDTYFSLRANLTIGKLELMSLNLRILHLSNLEILSLQHQLQSCLLY
jgi:hypothetical protein